MPSFSAVQGNVYNPAYMPGFNEFKRPYSIGNRAKNLFSMIVFANLWRRTIVPLIQTEVGYRFSLISIYNLLIKSLVF